MSDMQNNQSSSFNSNAGLTKTANLEVLSYEARRLAKATITKALQTANPHLVPATGELSTLIVASKNIRIELKKVFPKTKFSVTTDRFAGGDAIRIRWNDGPTTEQVEAISNKYEAGSFDGSQDLYEYKDSAWIEAFGDAKYITTNRDHSPELITATIEEVAAQFHDGELPTAEDYKQGRLFYTSPSRHSESWQHLVSRAMWKKST